MKTAYEVVRKIQHFEMAACLPDELYGLNVLLMQCELLQICQDAIIMLRTLQSKAALRVRQCTLLRKLHAFVSHTPAAGARA